MAAKSAAPSPPPAPAEPPPPSFEEALTQLEGLVTALEGGEVPLAELVAKFAEGTRLLRVCESHLKDAELKIETITRQGDRWVTQPGPTEPAG